MGESSATSKELCREDLVGLIRTTLCWPGQIIPEFGTLTLDPHALGDTAVEIAFLDQNREKWTTALIKLDHRGWPFHLTISALSRRAYDEIYIYEPFELVGSLSDWLDWLKMTGD